MFFMLYAIVQQVYCVENEKAVSGKVLCTIHNRWNNALNYDGVGLFTYRIF